MRYMETEKAAKADKKSRWDLIEAIAHDADANDAGITSAASIMATKAACDRVGNELTERTLKALCGVAKYDAESTAAQRKVWRRYGWSVIDELAKRSVPQEQAARKLGASAMSWRDVRSFAEKVSGVAPRLEESTLDQRIAAWAKRMARDLIEGVGLKAEVEETPGIVLSTQSAFAMYMLDAINEKHLDAELRNLLSEEGVA